MTDEKQKQKQGRPYLTPEQKEESKRKRREYLNNRNKNLYKNDPDFKERAKQRASKCYHRKMNEKKETKKQEELFEMYMKLCDIQII